MIGIIYSTTLDALFKVLIIYKINYYAQLNIARNTNSHNPTSQVYLLNY